MNAFWPVCSLARSLPYIDLDSDPHYPRGSHSKRFDLRRSTTKRGCSIPKDQTQRLNSRVSEYFQIPLLVYKTESTCSFTHARDHDRDRDPEIQGGKKDLITQKGVKNPRRNKLQ